MYSAPYFVRVAPVEGGGLRRKGGERHLAERDEPDAFLACGPAQLGDLAGNTSRAYHSPPGGPQVRNGDVEPRARPELIGEGGVGAENR
jgi:hypothetical protein